MFTRSWCRIRPILIDSIGEKLSPLQITWEFSCVLREVKPQNPVGPSFFFPLRSRHFVYMKELMMFF